MRRKCFYITLLLFHSLLLTAQRQERHAIDSLQKLLQSEHYLHTDDSNKAKILIRLSWNYYVINADTGISYGQQAFDMATRLGWERGRAKAYAAIGDAYGKKMNFTKAIDYYAKSLEVAERINAKPEIATALGNSAEDYFKLGDYKKALEDFFKALSINKELGNKKNIANDLNGIGNVYTEQGYYSQALEYHIKALALFEELGSEINVANSHLNIGNILLEEASYKKALENYNKALEINKSLDNKTGIAGCYVSIGSVYQRTGDFVRSLEYYDKALKIHDELQDEKFIAELANNIGVTYYKQKRYINAVEYFLASLKLFNDEGSREGVAFNMAALGDCFVEIIKAGYADTSGKGTILVDHEISRYVSAVNIPAGKPALLHAAMNYYHQALALSKEMNMQLIMQASYLGLSEAHKLDNDYKKALEYADTATALKDSIFSKENNDRVARLEMQSEYAQQHLADSLKHAQEIQAEKFKIQKQRMALYILLGIFVAAIAAIITMNRIRIARAKAEQQRQLLETELKALRAQMDPHFIFNSLNSIQAFILKENKIAASDYLQKFSKLIRMILDNSQKSSNTIEDETEILTLYLELEQLRLKDKFDFEIMLSENANPTFTEIPSMVMQPLVENSIWHGLMHAGHKGMIKIAFIKEQNQLRCTVEDNGIGISKAKQRKNAAHTHESKGISLVESRLKAWSTVKGLKYSFRMCDNAEQGTRTEITIFYPEYA